MQASKSELNKIRQAGFSLLELLIAMVITLAMMVAASTLLAASLRTRTRENARSEALAGAQRALNLMTREIGNSGYGLIDNGIVAGDSGATSIRVRANLNNNTSLADVDEDIRFVYQTANKAIVRFDSFPAPSGSRTALASNIDDLTLTYWDFAGLQITNPASYSSAERIRIAVRVDLPAGTGQPASVVRLISDVALRNAPKTLEQF
jgi:prepilin-type N-terminal cleavage/methylation domain-containing protein